jgi:hypothetical protein
MNGQTSRKVGKLQVSKGKDPRLGVCLELYLPIRTHPIHFLYVISSCSFFFTFYIFDYLYLCLNSQDLLGHLVGALLKQAQFLRII